MTAEATGANRGVAQTRNTRSGATAEPGQGNVSFDKARSHYGDLAGFLLEEKMVQPGELTRALEICASKGGFLGKILSDLGAFPEADLTSRLAKTCGIPHINLRDYYINRDLAGVLPAELCKNHFVLPLDRLGRNLTLAIVDPFDTNTLQAVREACPDLRIRPILCAYSDYLDVLATLFGEDVWVEEDLQVYPLLEIPELEAALARGVHLIDTRQPTHFGAAFIPGSVNIGISLNAARWLGMLLTPQMPFAIVADRTDRVQEAIKLFRAAGFNHIAGYLDTGVEEWTETGKPLGHLPQLSVQSLQEVLDKYPDHCLADVRTEAEYNAGHIERAVSRPLPGLLRDGLDFPPSRHITIVCASGYCANIAGSFLKARGYPHVYSLAGGMTAWDHTHH